MKHNTPKISSIEKALDILQAFSRHNSDLGTVELSQNLDLHPATVNRILQILSRKGFLHQNKQTLKFTLGPSAFYLGRKVFQSLSGNLLKFAVPYIENLAEEEGQTVVLEVMSGKDSIVTYIEQGKHGYLIGPKIGNRVPLHASAGGKAMIAFYDQDRIDSLLDRKLTRYTPKTIIDLKVLKLELKKVKAEGVAFCREEMAIGLNAIAVPIFDHDNNPVASLVVVGQTSILNCDSKSSTVGAVKSAASEISALIFHPNSMEKRDQSY